MKLLCLLAAKPDGLVTREEIIEKIWNGYGGGDEGLTQAISNLRKILNDTDKIIIETVPKSGYIFRGRIEPLDEPINRPSVLPARAGYISYKFAGIIVVILLLIFSIILFVTLSKRTIAPKTLPNLPGETQTEHYAPKAPR